MLFAAALLAVSGYGQTPPNASACLNQGMQAYKDARYPEAVELLRKAVPENCGALLFSK